MVSLIEIGSRLVGKLIGCYFEIVVKDYEFIWCILLMFDFIYIYINCFWLKDKFGCVFGCLRIIF